LSPRLTKIPVGLARVRKALPPPGRIIKSKKIQTRKRAKADLREKLKESLAEEGY
jgi:hypothetical protein